MEFSSSFSIQNYAVYVTKYSQRNRNILLTLENVHIRNRRQVILSILKKAQKYTMTKEGILR